MNGFWFYSILAGWLTWQWVFLNFSQNFWSFDTHGTPGCASAVIWFARPIFYSWCLTHKCKQQQLDNSTYLRCRLFEILRYLDFSEQQYCQKWYCISLCSVHCISYHFASKKLLPWMVALNMIIGNVIQQHACKQNCRII